MPLVGLWPATHPSPGPSRLQVVRGHAQRTGGVLAERHQGEGSSAHTMAPRRGCRAYGPRGCGVPEPKSVNGTAQSPMQGVSMLYSFDDALAKDRHLTQYFE